MTIRLTERSIIYGTRSKKRFAIFVLAFITLSLLTIMSINSLNTENEEFLLSEKAVILRQSGWNSASESAFSGTVEALGDAFGTSVPTKYFEWTVGTTNIRIFSTTPNSWSNNLAAPNLMTNGRYVLYKEEAIISEDFVINLDSTTPTFEQTIEVGSYMKFSPGTSNEINLYITGKFRPVGKNTLDPGYVWMFVHEDTFEELRASIGATSYYYSVTYIAHGSTMLSAFFGDAYDNMNNIYSEVSTYALANSEWQRPDPPGLTSKRSNSQLKEMMFIIGVIGGMIASSLYAYLISRFRRREVAVLKALGFSNNNVRIVLLSEIVTVSMIGFTIGLTILQLWLIFSTTHTSYTPNLFGAVTTWISFVIVALSNIVAYLIVSQRTSAVKPMELFRGA